VEVLDAYEEEVRKLSFAAEVFQPIEFDPVKFHLALQCRGLRSDLGLPPPPDSDPLDRSTEEWDAEVVGLQTCVGDATGSWGPSRGGLRRAGASTGEAQPRETRRTAAGWIGK
jgi:hypothetical protein